MQKKQGIVGSHVVSEFGGIDRSSEFCKNTSAAVIENFRILTDGSLVKRGGYKYKLTLSQTPRYIWSGELCGEEQIFAVFDYGVYTMEPQSGVCYYIGSLTNNNKEVIFLFYDEELYIFDGTYLFKYSSSGVFSRVEGYVPLMGEGWDPIGMGEINEAVNLISPNVTIRYKIVGTPSRLNLGFSAIGIVNAYFEGGRVLSASELSLSPDGTYVNCDFDESDCSLIVCLSRAGFEQSYKNVCNGSGAFVATASSGSRIYTYGGDNKPIVCASRRVSERQIRFSQKHFPLSDGIYFPLDECLYIDGGARINAVCSVYDMLFMFTESTTYAKDTDSKDNSIKLVNATVGCSSRHGLFSIGDELYTVCKSGIYKWDTAISTKGRIHASLISQPVSDIVDEEFALSTKIYNCANKNELWFTLPENRILAYNTERNAFYEFTNINNSLMFYYFGEIAFTINRKIFLLSDTKVCDLDENLNLVDINARYISNYIDCSDIQTKKHMARFSLICDTKGKDLSMCFHADCGSSVSLCLAGDASFTPQLIKRRLPLGRFLLMNFTITSSERARQQIYSLAISADVEKQ